MWVAWCVATRRIPSDCVLISKVGLLGRAVGFQQAPAFAVVYASGQRVLEKQIAVTHYVPRSKAEGERVVQPFGLGVLAEVR